MDDCNKTSLLLLYIFKSHTKASVKYTGTHHLNVNMRVRFNCHGETKSERQRAQIKEHENLNLFIQHQNKTTETYIPLCLLCQDNKKYQVSCDVNIQFK